MYGLMQDRPLLIASLIDYAGRYHGTREVVTRTVEGPIHRYTYAQAERRAKRLAKALMALGIKPGDRVATLAWNTFRHFELFYGVSGVGAVLHTVNPRLFEDQIRYIVNHAEDRLVFLDTTFVELVEKLASDLPTVERFVLLCAEDDMPETTLKGAVSYESLIAEHDDDYVWPEFDERLASSLCYTSGTTGNPKGVLYSHRSTVLHAMAAAQNSAFGLDAFDVIMPVSPMYHANGWSLPYVAPMCGAKLVLPGTRMDGASIHELIDAEKVTFTCGVPTVWNLLIAYMREHGLSVDSLKSITIGGSVVPKAMIDAFRDDYDVMVRQVWGMTETSPLGTMSTPIPALDTLGEEDRRAILEKPGRVQFGLEIRIVDADGQPVPRDGVTFGDMWVRGAWVASGYFRGEGGDVLGDDGWFPTGDVATLDEYGYMKITDRTKDVIKSGGEWISSIDIENIVSSHPRVHQAAVIGVRHAKWDERPLLIVVPTPGQDPDKRDILAHLEGRIAKWWMPDDVVLVDELPMTATGKIHKKTLREKFADYLIDNQHAEEGIRDSDDPVLDWDDARRELLAEDE